MNKNRYNHKIFLTSHTVYFTLTLAAYNMLCRKVGLLVKSELERIWKESYYPGIGLGGLRETTKLRFRITVFPEDIRKKKPSEKKCRPLPLPEPLR
jgi:hypothetical protein